MACFKEIIHFENNALEAMDDGKHLKMHRTVLTMKSISRCHLWQGWESWLGYVIKVMINGNKAKILLFLKFTNHDASPGMHKTLHCYKLTWLVLTSSTFTHHFSSKIILKFLKSKLTFKAYFYFYFTMKFSLVLNYLYRGISLSIN